jgi:EmrB/QacA subfamily drug resistance transporter
MGSSDAPSKWSVFAIIAVGVFMCTLDTSIVNVSLPAIAKYFGGGVGAEVEAVIIVYLVVIASTLLTVGRLSDRVGRRRIWIAGLGVFTLGSMLCGAAPALWALIAARVLQGVGGSMLMAVSPAMLVAAFPPAERGRALGLNTMVVALGITAGPALGGLVTQTASWRWIFYINVPIGIAGAIAAIAVLGEDRSREQRRFDLAGATLLGLALGSLTTVLSIGNEAGWRSSIVLMLAAVFVIALPLFVVQELNHEAPLLDHKLFENRLFAWATVALVLSFLAVFAQALLLPIYFEQVRGFSLKRTGLLLTAFPVGIAVVAPISGHLADRFGTRWLAALGMAILAVGLWQLSRLDTSSSTWGVIWPQLVAALGMALFQSPNNSAIMGSAPRDRQGVAAGMLATGRTMGQSISVAIAGAVLGAASMRAAFLVCAAIAACAVGIALMRGRG